MYTTIIQASVFFFLFALSSYHHLILLLDAELLALLCQLVEKLSVIFKQ